LIVLILDDVVATGSCAKIAANFVPLPPVSESIEYFTIQSVNSLLVMTKKNVIVLTVTFMAVIGFYLYLFRDSFRKPNIQISHTIRPNPAFIRHPPQGVSSDELPQSINFGLSGEFKLTSVKVVVLSELETNRFAHPLWELVSDSNSAPTRAFSYGHRIKGMHSSVKNAAADPLVPNVTYRLLVESHALKGQHDFQVTEDERVK
jgi:hypothetical protein